MKLSWVFDVISPFSYLSIKQLHRLPPQVKVEFVPVLFAALLDHHGQLGNGEIPSKRRFTYRFALWRARKLGIPMQLPPAHPFNPLPALRLVVAAGSDRRAAEALLDAVFMHGRDVADPQVLDDIARHLGIDNLQTVIADEQIKQRLRANTEWALSKGIFGVPTFVIGDEIFWGHDALDMALEYLQDPAPFEDAGMRQIDTLPVGVERQRKPRPA